MSLASSPSRPSLRRQFVDADFDLAGLGALLWQKRYSILRPTIIVALLTLAVVRRQPDIDRQHPQRLKHLQDAVLGRDRQREDHQIDTGRAGEFHQIVDGAGARWQRGGARAGSTPHASLTDWKP